MYPGGKVELELNLTEKDFLPLVREAIMEIPSCLPTILAGEMPTDTAKPQQEGVETEVSGVSWLGLVGVAAKELQEALAGLEQISVIRYRLPEQAPSEQIADFYLGKLGLTKGWMSTLRLEPGRGVMVRLYVKPDLESMFGLMVEPSGVAAVRTEGKVDLTAIGKWAARFIPLVVLDRRTETHAPAPPAQKTAKSERDPEGQGQLFDVILVSVGEQGDKVVETIAKELGFSMAETMSFVGRVPTSLLTGVSKERAEAVKAKLEAAGATVQIKDSQ